MPDPDALISYQLSVAISNVEFIKREPLIEAFESLVLTKPESQIMVEKYNMTLFLGAEIESDPTDPMDIPRIMAILAEYLWNAYDGFVPLKFTATPLVAAEAFSVEYFKSDYDAFIDEKKGKSDGLTVADPLPPLAPGGDPVVPMDWSEM